ncbi:GD10351 [Drosophila simulans]|uniref:GD10351 n=1 Tax=Drosophila simulans TaxID=7240 RepID=B4QCN9_DROSI|nr:GD10351 [Drosophila simulans]
MSTLFGAQSRQDGGYNRAAAGGHGHRTPPPAEQNERVTQPLPADRERLSLPSLEVITDALLEIMEACMRDVPDCEWLNTWTSLARSFAFCYNPALQPRHAHIC